MYLERYFIVLQFFWRCQGKLCTDGCCYVQFKMRNTSTESIIFQTREKVKPLVEIVKQGVKSKNKANYYLLTNQMENKILAWQWDAKSCDYRRCFASKGYCLFWFSICSNQKLKLHNTDGKLSNQSGTLNEPFPLRD